MLCESPTPVTRMTTAPRSPFNFPFDAVLFDLDGTLVATERYWPDAAREACLEVFPRLGLQREIPPPAVWMNMVGLPLVDSFDEVFADLEPDLRGQILEACVVREHALLARGQAALLNGVEATLTELRGAGVRLGIASNCSQDYLDVMLGEVGLGKWIEEGRCLESRGVLNKADMVEDLLLTFGTRSAVMVGDRAGDRNAAWANGLPHVHVDRGYAFAPERVEAEAVLDGMDQLVPRLREREAWLDKILAELEPQPGGVLGITGRSAAGKTLMGRDLARRLEFAGQRAVCVSMDDFERSDEQKARRAPARSAEQHLAYAFDLETLQQEVLRPHREGAGVAFVLRRLDGAEQFIQVPRDAVLVLDGLFLAHPDVRGDIDRLLHLVVSDEVILRRVVGRDGRLSGVSAVDRVRREYLPTQREFEQLFAPREVADLVVIADNPIDGGGF